MKIKLPEKRFFYPQELADRWECSVHDVIHLIETSEIECAEKCAALRGKRRVYFGYYAYEKREGRPCFQEPPTEEGKAAWEREARPDQVILECPVPMDPPFDRNNHDHAFSAYLKFQEMREEWRAGRPEDFETVILLQDVLTFESRMIEQEVNAAEDKPLKTTERNSLLTIIAALCDYSAIDPAARGAATQISKLTDDIGSHVDDGTVRKWLKLIPEACEARQK